MLILAVAVSLAWASNGDSAQRSACQVRAACHGVQATQVQAEQLPPATSHVRTLNPHLLAALHEGIARSKTLRQLVATLDASDVVVYLDEGVCSDAAACTMIAGTANDVRWLRTNFVLRTPTGATSLLCHRERLIAQIGHELQHAVEIADHVEVNDERTLSQLYARIGRRRGRTSAYESVSAMETGERVLAEVREPDVVVNRGRLPPLAAGSPSIATVTFTQAAVAADTLAGAKTEVTGIFGQAGVGVTWMDPDAAKSAGDFPVQLLSRTPAVNGASKAITDALALLPEDVQMQIGEIIVVTSPDGRWRRQAYPVVQAQVFEGDDTIYVAHWGDAFRQAAAGKPVWLASAIVHEMTHLRNGPDERVAYDAQLATLRRLKAPATLIRNIERAKAVAVDARK